ncbi:MAG: 23S rRNA (uracil(1939)-C(5))-methyltransferase RlmD [Flavobacteriales bacterium TMED123]|nr:MAG: 23S rRNA (uracil(1939)-C(5))-methyltransferase RlmD [Flavobacteriales bacterium TMED123]|tara:strand:+ start:3155 stop:4567 length:1413 start_codon:yes stop_codon:yes gene_type:complete
MTRQNRRKPIFLENIKIINTASKGKSVAKHEGRAIFVQGGVPGDICDITVFKRRKKYWEGQIEKIRKYSKKRIESKCEHFGTCGGCKWQNMQYSSQLEFKQNEVLNNLKRIGGIELPRHDEILGSKNQYFYRNKMEFTFSNKRWLTLDEIQSKEEISDKDALGFHIPGMFDKVIDLQNCYLQKKPSNSIRLSVKQFADKNGLTYFDIRNHNGLLRNLMIRTSSTQDLMVLVQFYEKDKKNIQLLMAHLKTSFPEITSLLYIINQKANNTIYDQEVICYHGKNHIMEEMDGLYFKIGAKSFFQTNSEQAKILYRKTKELANINSDDIVYDLYTGTGTIAQYVANTAKEVVGIDSVEEGIKAAYKNAERNNINNCSFYTGDMKEIFTDGFIEQNGNPDVIITDPPRDGMHKKVVEQILKIGPKRVVYVSCNSATQARDLSLIDRMYKVTQLQALDMFPQTQHVENIVVLDKR